MEVYLFFIGERYYGAVSIKNGTKMSKWNENEIESFKTFSTNTRIYKIHVEY